MKNTFLDIRVSGGDHAQSKILKRDVKSVIVIWFGCFCVFLLVVCIYCRMWRVGFEITQCIFKKFYNYEFEKVCSFTIANCNICVFDLTSQLVH